MTVICIIVWMISVVLVLVFMKRMLEIICDYATFEGLRVYETCIASKHCRYNFIKTKKCIIFYINDKGKPIYRVSTIKDCINFCLIVSSIEEMYKISVLK